MKRIQLTQNQFAIVDDKNFEWLSQWKWSARWSKITKSFYALRNSKEMNAKRHTILMAREILGLKRGDKKHSDHKNHNTLDNRESNLRIVTNQQNQWNQKNVKGYSWSKARKKYFAQIRVDGKQIYLGLFDTAKEARIAYLKAKEEYHKL